MKTTFGIGTPWHQRIPSFFMFFLDSIDWPMPGVNPWVWNHSSHHLSLWMAFWEEPLNVAKLKYSTTSYWMFLDTFWAEVFPTLTSRCSPNLQIYLLLLMELDIIWFFIFQNIPKKITEKEHGWLPRRSATIDTLMAFSTSSCYGNHFGPPKTHRGPHLVSTLNDHRHQWTQLIYHLKLGAKLVGKGFLTHEKP